ncbi:MAG: dihydrodipicolinate synthase family protein [Phycisphaerae bacterium]
MSAKTAKPRGGVIVPMITPLTDAGKLDEKSLSRVVDHLLAGGVDVIFVLGTTGEAASLSADMRSRLVAGTVEHVGGRIPVYAGISGNCLAESLAAAKEYLARGAEALVAHLPTYFPLNDEEQYRYFKALLDGASGPLILYNIPQTTNMTIPLDVVERLSEHPNAAGLKDSSPDVARTAELLMRMGKREKFPIFMGHTAFAAQGLAQGAAGYVPSTGNLAPTLCRHLYEAARAGEVDRAAKHQAALNTVGRLYQGNRSVGQSIAALKALMSEAKLCGPAVLPPLRTLDPAQRKQLLEGLKAENLTLTALAR